MFNPLNPELNPIFHLLALLRAHHILHVSGLRVKTIEGAAGCEIRSVIRFLNARNVLPSEIHHQFSQVYGDNTMSGGMIMKWFRMFNEG